MKKSVRIVAQIKTLPATPALASGSLRSRSFSPTASRSASCTCSRSASHLFLSLTGWRARNHSYHCPARARACCGVSAMPSPVLSARMASIRASTSFSHSRNKRLASVELCSLRQRTSPQTAVHAAAHTPPAHHRAAACGRRSCPLCPDVT